MICLISLIDTRNNKTLANLTRSIKYSLTGYKSLIVSLEKEYGSETIQVETAYQAFFDGTVLDPTSVESVQNFRTTLISYGNVLDSYGRRHIDFAENSPFYKKILTEKLTNELRTTFQLEQIAREAEPMRQQWAPSPDGILVYMDILQGMLFRSTPITKKQINQTQETNLLTQDNKSDNTVTIDQDATDDDIQSILFAAAQMGQRSTLPPCDWKGKGCQFNHLLKQCPKFIGLTDQERLKHIQQSDRCFNCFRKNHMAKSCNSKARCGHCKKTHNTLVHKAFDQTTPVTTTLLGKNETTSSLFTSPISLAKNPRAEKFETNAIHDPGATCSLISKDLAEKMNLEGVITPINMQTLNSTNKIETASKVSVNIYDHTGTARGILEASVIPNFIKLDATDWSEKKNNFPHLKDVPIPKPFADRRCDVLIGNNCARLSITIDSAAIDRNNTPVAGKSVLGWSIGGPTINPPKETEGT